MLRLWKLLSVAAAIAVAGCGGDGGSGGVGGSKAVCSDYRYQEDAQSAYLSGATQLDGDHDGIACESLPHRPSGGGGGGGTTGNGGGTEVPPAPAYNLMSSLGEVTVLRPTGAGQYAMSFWGSFGSVADAGPIGYSTSGSTTQVASNFIGVRFGAKSSDLLPAWSSHGPTPLDVGVDGIGFVPTSRTLSSAAGAYRAIGQACQQGLSPCKPVFGTFEVLDSGVIRVCVSQDVTATQCVAPLVLPVTRDASDPDGVFMVGHITARMLLSSTGSVALSYQDAYDSPLNPNPTFTRTTWFGVPYGTAELTPLAGLTFEGFANAGHLTSTPATGWSLQDNVPLSGFRSDASGRLVLKGSNGPLVTWSPEGGLQTFVQR